MNLDKQVDRRKVTAGLLIGAGAVLIYCLLTNLTAVGDFFKRILGYLSPVTWGLLLAYLMRPMAKRLEKLIPPFIKSPKARLHIGVLTTFVIVLIIIFLVVYMLVPQLLSSATTFVNNIDFYLASIQNAVRKLADQFELTDSIAGFYDLSGNDLIKKVSNWFTENLAYVANLAVNFGSYAMNFVISLMIAVYALLDRHNLKKGLRRVESLVLAGENLTRVNEIISRGDSLMMKFLTSNLLDALLIGVINFVFLGVVKAPYQLLLAVVLGITNFIPTFGPIIGGVMVGAVVLITKPTIFLAFVLFTLILQQIDGNVIKPLLFGDSTGLSPFWVLVAIVVGGRVFGIIGMIVGVPIVALMRSVIRELLDKHDKKQALQAAQAQKAQEEPTQAES